MEGNDLVSLEGGRAGHRKKQCICIAIFVLEDVLFTLASQIERQRRGPGLDTVNRCHSAVWVGRERHYGDPRSSDHLGEKIKNIEEGNDFFLFPWVKYFTFVFPFLSIYCNWATAVCVNAGCSERQVLLALLVMMIVIIPPDTHLNSCMVSFIYLWRFWSFWLTTLCSSVWLLSSCSFNNFCLFLKSDWSQKYACGWWSFYVKMPITKC